MACRPVQDGDEVKGCFFECKQGRLAILAGNTVDCTGEADLAWRAGGEVRQSRGSSSLLFKFEGVDIDRFVNFLGEDPDGFPAGMDWIKDYDECASLWRDDGVFFFPHHGGKKWRWLQEVLKKSDYGQPRDGDKYPGRPWWGPAENIEAFGMYTHRRDGSLYINTGYYCFDTVEIRDFSKCELHAQRLCYRAADFMIRHIPGFENAKVGHIGVDLGRRGARYITGRSRMRRADLEDATENTLRDDVIGTTGVQSSKAGMRPGSLGTTCDVPFGACVPVNLRRLVVGSGKSVDTEGGSKPLYRGMSGCMVFGQATGAAAAVGTRLGTPAGDVPIRELQRELLRQGVRLGDEARLKELGLSG
jgi:hypothetical protein